MNVIWYLYYLTHNFHNYQIPVVIFLDLYGDSFVERQYIPYCADMIKSASQKMNHNAESALLGVSSMLDRIFQYISDTVLMTVLQVRHYLFVICIVSLTINLIYSVTTGPHY